jgi:hypothetical protein
MASMAADIVEGSFGVTKSQLIDPPNRFKGSLLNLLSIEIGSRFLKTSLEEYGTNEMNLMQQLLE